MRRSGEESAGLGAVFIGYFGNVTEGDRA
jgi:hypothetical protein